MKNKKLNKRKQPKKKLGLFDRLAKTDPIGTAMIRYGYGNTFKL